MRRLPGSSDREGTAHFYWRAIRQSFRSWLLPEQAGSRGSARPSIAHVPTGDQVTPHSGTVASQSARITVRFGPRVPQLPDRGSAPGRAKAFAGGRRTGHFEYLYFPLTIAIAASPDCHQRPDHHEP